MATIISGTNGVDNIAPNTVSPEDLVQRPTTLPQQAATGTLVDFSNIPSWAKRVTVFFKGLSTNGTSSPIVQLRVENAPVTSGYLGGASTQTGGIVTNHSTGFIFSNAHTAAYLLQGRMELVKSVDNSWSEISLVNDSAATNSRYSSGNIDLTGQLDGIRVTTTNGTDSFDAGNIVVSYE